MAEEKDDKKKEIKGFTIEVSDNSVKFTQEENTYPWWKDRLNRKKDSIVCPEIYQDMMKIAFNLSKKNEKGQLVGKYSNVFMRTLSSNPKSSQGEQKTVYKDYLISQLERDKSELLDYKDKKLFLYVCIYLRKERFETNDVDNFLKAIVDAFKPFVGDDSNIVSIVAEKKQLGNYPGDQMDFLEQIFVVLTEPDAKVDILK